LGLVEGLQMSLFIQEEALEYVVQPGDCILSIASKHGFLWQRLWNANPELKARRDNPNVIFPGDLVQIPQKVVKEASCVTDQLHKFAKKGTLAKFRVIVERFNVPLANRRYLVEIDGKLFDGTTDDTGLLEVNIDPAARTGRLRMPDDGVECALELGHLDPLDEFIGVQQRLHNLGFYFGELDGNDNQESRDAIADFQASVSIEATGDLDDSTREKLFQMQDRQHPQAQPETVPEEQIESAPTGPPEAIQAKIDLEEDAAEMARFTALDDETVPESYPWV
jgi:hypothetical protein